MSNIKKIEKIDASVLSAAVTNFVTRYRLSVRKTATSILELANVVYDAKNSLNDNDYEKFRVAIEADSKKDSYLKKLCKIAENSKRFESIKELLPSSYTTLYALAQLPDETFNSICNEDLISPRMTATQLCAFAKSTSNIKSVAVSKSCKNLQNFSFTVDFENITKHQTRRFLKRIRDLCIENGAQVDFEISDKYSIADAVDVESRPIAA